MTNGIDIMKKHLEDLIYRIDRENIYDSGLALRLKECESEEDVVNLLDIVVNFKYDVLRLRHTINVYLVELKELTSIKETKKEILDNIINVYRDNKYDFDNTIEALYQSILKLYKNNKKSIA